MTVHQNSLGRRALAALGLLVGVQLLMGDAIAPGCCGSHASSCADNEAIALTFAVSGDCSAPGMIQISSAAGSCKLAVEGHPEWLDDGYREGSSIANGGWRISLFAGIGDRCPISPSASVPDEYIVTCNRVDAAVCSSVFRLVP